MSLYDQIPLMPPDPIFGVSAAYLADSRPDKLTLVTGYFRDKELKVPLMRCVAEVEERISEAKIRREYLPIVGDLEFIDHIGELSFGEQYDNEVIGGFQTVGGTGALCLAGKLISRFTKQIAISNHTWANHWNIFKAAGLNTESYPYYQNKQLLFTDMVMALEKLSEGSAVLLHACGHNPTGLDLSHEQWQELAALFKRRRLYPVIDMAYQGFCKQPHEDAYGPRLFFEKGIEFALTYTCSKNFSVYGERVGALYFVVHDKEALEKVKSQIKVMIRQIYSEPPTHAAEIVKGVLGDSHLKAEWLTELAEMRERMAQARKDFVAAITHKDPGGGWEALAEGSGLFAMTELDQLAVERLRDERGIYATVGGRVNLTGLNMANLERVVDAIIDVQ